MYTTAVCSCEVTQLSSLSLFLFLQALSPNSNNIYICNGVEWSKDRTQAAESIKWRPQQAYGYFNRIKTTFHYCLLVLNKARQVDDGYKKNGPRGASATN